MRVLHLWDTYSPSLFDQSHSLCLREGLDSELICLNFIHGVSEVPPHVRFARRLDSGIGAGSLAARIARRLRSGLGGRRFKALVRDQIAQHPPDVIHIHYGTTAALLFPLAAVFNRPVIISFYGFDISQALRSKRTVSRYRAIMARKPLIHVLCDAARQRVIELGCLPQNIVDANLPVNVDRYPEIGLTGARISRWLIPARFVEKKGHAILLPAFKAFHCDHPEATLTCWGYGPTTWLKELSTRLGLDDCVRVINNGQTPDFDAAYIRLLEKHDVVLAPSLSSRRGDDEGGPALTVVMAQAAAKPVILSDFPGSERSVTNGVEGLVVLQNDVGALTAAMNSMAASPNRAAAMGRAGRQRVLVEFDQSAYRDNLLGWYRRLAR